ncbi:MAG TPA: LytTR family DNA-binding domain-containing protein [Pyrinomonadaceae bacterium]|jgi:two-component system LytT family response regulator
MRQKLRALIVDDERLARKELRSMLGERPEITVEGEAESVAEAVELIRAEEPDIVFLDIHMHGESGFDLLEKVDVPFKVIFITAFDAYAIRAFEVNALDYLLKPVNPERLARAVERLFEKQADHEDELRKLDYSDRVFLALDDERSRFLKVNAIEFISGAGDYSDVFTSDGQKILTPKPLREWEERLPEKYFYRIHRSTIINLECVDRIERWFNRAYRVHLHHAAEPLVMSRRYAARLRSKYG